VHRRVAIALSLAGLGFLAWLASRSGARHPPQTADFFDFYYAAVAARLGTPLHESGDGGYIYPPLLAVLLTPLSHLGPSAARLAWAALLTALLPVAAWLSARVAARSFGLPAWTPGVVAAGALAVILLGETWKSEFEWLNCDLLLILATVGALVLLERRPALAGGLLGAAAAIKYLPLLFLPYLIVRGRWRAAAGLAVGLGAALLLPAAYLGWDRNLAALGVAVRGLGGMSGVVDQAGAAVASGAARIEPVVAGYSMSVTSAAARVAEGAGLGRPWGLAIAGVVAAACTGLAWSLYHARGERFWRRRPPDAVDGALTAVEWSGVVVAGLLFSPQTSHRHLNMLLPVVALACALALLGSPRRRGAILLVAGQVVLLVGATAVPGLPGLRRATELWSAYGGKAACVAGMYATVLWVGLDAAGRLRGGRADGAADQPRMST